MSTLTRNDPYLRETTQRLLVQRLRAALWIILLGLALLTLRDLWYAPGAWRPWYAVRLVEALAVATLLRVLRFPRVARWAAPLALLASSSLCLDIIGVSTLRHDLVTPPIVLIGEVMFAATLFPWGLWWQLAGVGVAEVTLIANALLVTGGVEPAVEPSGIAAIGIFMGSLYVAYELDRSRRALDRRTIELNDEMAERRRAELALQESERRYRLLAEHQSDIIWTMNLDFQLTYLSPSVQRLRGYTAEEAIALPLDQTLTPASLETAVTVIGDALALECASGGRERPSRTLELEHTCKDGSTIWLELNTNFLRDEHGAIIGILGVSRDVRERKRAQDALAHAHATLQGVLDGATQVSIIATDPTGMITVFNAGAEQMLGYTAAEMIGRHTPEVIHLESEVAARAHVLAERLGYPVQDFEALVALARRGEYEECQWTYVRKDGSQFSATVCVTALRDAHGEITGFLCMGTDITERKRVEAELQRAKDAAEAVSRAKSEFVANISHEIRTPLNGIIGMTELALETELTAEQREYLDLMKVSADSLLTIINDVLDFSKIEAGKLDLARIGFRLRDCLTDTLKVQAAHARQKGLGLAWHVAAAVPDALVGDPGHLRQVLTNLVGNAIKFTARGQVVVEVGRADPGEGHPAIGAPQSAIDLHFAVRDTGIGVPAAKQDRIFEAFHQADGSTTPRFGGTGLGLTICRRLVELMGGRIWVESVVGQGSTFHFTVRLASAGTHDAEWETPVATKSVCRTPQSALPALRILLAEDNPVNQRLAVRLLQGRGHRVVVAASGREAVEALAHESFDLVLMDLQMPDMDGFEATAAIRERERGAGHIPIVAMTAHALKRDEERCRAAGMDGYVSKPIDPGKLLDEMRRVVPAFAAVDVECAAGVAEGARALSSNET